MIDLFVLFLVLIELDSIKHLRRQQGYAENVINETLKDITDNDGIFLLALHESHVVGFIVGILEKQTPKQLLGADPAIMGRIIELYVDSSYRASGIGSKLMEELEKDFRKKKCEYVWVEVFKPNENAYKFYRKFNFADRDIEMIKKL